MVNLLTNEWNQRLESIVTSVADALLEALLHGINKMGSLYEMLRSSSVFQDKIEKLCLDNVAALVLQEVIISSVQREEQFDNYEHHRLYFCFQFSSFTWNFFEWCPNEQLEYSVINIKTLVLTVINLETYKGFVKEPIMHYLSTCGPPHLICFIFLFVNFRYIISPSECTNLNSCVTWIHANLSSRGRFTLIHDGIVI